MVEAADRRSDRRRREGRRRSRTPCRQSGAAARAEDSLAVHRICSHSGHRLCACDHLDVHHRCARVGSQRECRTGCLCDADGGGRCRLSSRSASAAALLGLSHRRIVLLVMRMILSSSSRAEDSQLTLYSPRLACNTSPETRV